MKIIPEIEVSQELADFARKVEHDIVAACVRNGNVWDGSFAKGEEINAYFSALAVAMVKLEETGNMTYGTVEAFIAAAREHQRQVKNREQHRP